MLNNLDLFSGIGMWSFTLRRILKSVAYCEIDADCQKVLENNISKKNIPPGLLFNDVQHLSGRYLSHLNLTSITGSFPCQDVSLAYPAGKGLAGKRSGLFFEIMRILDELPSVQMVLLENTPVIVKRGLATVLDEFHKRGFEVAWGIFSAADVGAPQIRRRFFAIAYRPGFQPPGFPDKNHGMKFDWKKEPVPRIIPRQTKPVDLKALKRNMMCGNSVVPQTVVWAYRCLRDVIIGKNHLIAKQPRTPLHTISLLTLEHIYRFQKPGKYRDRPVVSVLMKKDSTVYKKSFWMSPPASNLWYQYKSISERSTFLLSNQIFWDTQTRRYIRQYGDSLWRQPQIDDRWAINPEFTEWLMGFPKGWTDFHADKVTSSDLDDHCDDPFLHGEIDQVK